MSNDVNIWTTRPLIKDKQLVEQYGLARDKDSFTHAHKDWHVTFTRSVQVDDDDIPDAAQAHLPGIRYLIRLNLHPDRSAKKARKLIKHIAKDIAKKYNGVIEDRHNASFTLPGGVKKRFPAVKGKKIPVVKMTWYFVNHKLQDKNGCRELISLLGAYLPEMLPKKYGLYEPPQYKYQSHELFVEFLHYNRHDTLVWYPRKPVLNVHLSLLDAMGGWSRIGQFCCNIFTMTIPYDLLLSEDWQLQLRRIWHKITFLLEPFYAEVRRLDGYDLSKGQVFSGLQSRDGPTRSGFWKGIPRRLGCAVVMSDLYADLWDSLPELKHYRKEKGFHFLSLPDWTDKRDLSDYIGKPPKNIRQRKQPKYGRANGGSLFLSNDEYPPDFPFDWER